MSGMKRAVAVGAVLAAMAGLASCSQPSAAPHTSTSSGPASSGTEPPLQAPTPTVVVSGVPFATNLTFDQHGGLWFTSGALGQNSTGGVWYVPAGGRPRHVVTGLARDRQ